MVLTIGQVPISFLGGPDYLRIIEPTEQLSTLCKSEAPTHHFPPLLIIGDDRKFTCSDVPDCLNDNITCLSTMSPVWFRLLDTLAFENQQVDYFLEANIYFKYINDTNLLSDDEKSITAFNIANSPLTYIPNYHPQCFKSKDKDLCMTQNVRYHVCDVRMYSDYVNYSPDHAITNLLVRYTNMSETEAHGIAKSWFGNPDNALHILTKYKIPSTEMDLPYYPYFESYLHYVMKKCLGLSRTRYKGGMDFFGQSGISLWQDFFASPSKFIKSLINHPKFTTHSIIMKQLRQHSFDAKKVKKLFAEFFLYYLSVCQIDDRNKSIVLKGISNYSGDLNEYHRNKSSLRVSDNKKSIYDKFEEYEEACDDLCINIFMAFTDFYMWVRSTKDSIANTSVLTVFNAGSNHTTFLSQFMVNKGFYKHHYQGGNENKNCYPTVPVRLHINRPLKYVVQIRCIKFVEDFSIDEMVYEKYDDPVVEDHHGLISTRLTILGRKRYLQMLRGKPFSENELSSIAQSHGMTARDIKTTLRLNSVLLPADYKDTYTVS